MEENLKHHCINHPDRQPAVEIDGVEYCRECHKVVIARREGPVEIKWFAKEIGQDNRINTDEKS